MNGKPFSSQYAVHPHIRGAYQFPRPVPVPHIGSSPPTWGIRCSTAPTIDISRFIPTYVGHTALAGWLHRPWRFIPTYVGHTFRAQWANSMHSVHPHIRGAYPSPFDDCFCKVGSSPHTWGIHNVHQVYQVQRRFIPTYVGHTFHQQIQVFCVAVHPHIRGAYFSL